LRSWQKKLRTVDEDLKGIWRNRGIHGTDKFRDWLDGHLQEFTGEQVEKLKHLRSLRILASNISRRKFRAFFAEKPVNGASRS
jgi:hypothetical protein